MQLDLTKYEEAPADIFPFPHPFLLSSVERSWCQRNPAKVVFIKRAHLEENIKAIGDDAGMDEAERKRFLDYWCSPSRHERSTIRAELDECFDLRQRMKSWMERVRPAEPQPKSRLEKYAESARQFYQNINHETETETIPPRTSGPQGFGYADIPDDQ